MNTITAARDTTRTQNPLPAGNQVVANGSPKGQVGEPRKMLSFGEELKARESQFKAALPAHIPIERFMRVVMTAIQRNNDLGRADRTTLFLSAMQAAQDGLLPDGREGALVIYNSKIKEDGKEIWIKMVQWMPMIAGIRKKVRNSGEITSWNAHVVHENDLFDYELGDDPFIKHKPILKGERGDVIAAYSVAVLKGGEKSFEVMTRSDLDKVRNASKSKDKGPWVDWFEEMCRKSVARRHSKVLPMSTDLDDLIRRDDELYDLKGAREEAAIANGGRPQSLTDRLDVLAQMPSRESAPAVDRGSEDSPQQGERPSATSDSSVESRKETIDKASTEEEAEKPNPAKIALMETLRKKAAKGSNALRLALKGLVKADEEMLTDEDHEALGVLADAADEEKADAE